MRSTTTAQTAFQQLDESTLSKFHFKAVITSGMGFFTDAYDLLTFILPEPDSKSLETIELEGEHLDEEIDKKLDDISMAYLPVGGVCH